MKLILIDDDPIVSASLKTILEVNSDIKVLEIGSDGNQALELYMRHSPDIILMDIRMKETNGIEAGKKIMAYDADARIVYLTTFLDDEYVDEALNLGAKGYLLKQDFANIVPALNSIMANQIVFGEGVMNRLQPRHQRFKHNDLSDKEHHLIELVAKGLNNKEIAEVVAYSEGTVRNQISALLEKLEVRDRTQLAIFYYQNLKK